MTLLNQGLFYLKYGNSRQKKYTLSLHKFPTFPLPDDMEERTSRWKDMWAKQFHIRRQKEQKEKTEELYSDSKIVEVIRTSYKLGHEHKFITKIIARRANGKIDPITEPDYKYLNKNDTEDLYLLCTESYQQKVNLTVPTITFPSIEREKLFTITSKPVVGMIYENNKKEKIVMIQKEIHNPSDADVEYLRFYEEDIEYRLKHQDQMRRGSYHIPYKRDYLVDFEEYDCGNILLGDGRECRVRGTGKVQVQMRDGSSFMLDNLGKMKVIKGSLVVLSGTIRANCVYTLDGQAVTMKILKGRKQLGEYQTGWKIKTGLHQQNGLVKETNMTLLAKVVLYRNMGFNESGEYKKTFIGFGVGMGLVQVLQGVEFEVEPQEDHTFEVEPHGNVDHVAGSQEVQTQDLIYYHSVRDREQHLAWELFSYRKDSNEAAFAVAAVDNIYAHESLTFNNTVACKEISKWKAGLKDNMDDRSDAEIWAIKGLLDIAKGNVLDMEIVRDQSGNTLRVSQSRFYNGKLVQTLLEGHSILSLESSLLGDCDVEKNGKWSCIYVVGSQEYQMVCTRLDIAFEVVGMLDKFDRRLQTNVQVFVDFDYAMGRSITVMGRSIIRYGLMIQGCTRSYDVAHDGFVAN
ncbi:hypothetical protein Tco_1295601 [Tanacetum coccineum]